MHGQSRASKKYRYVYSASIIQVGEKHETVKPPMIGIIMSETSDESANDDGRGSKPC